MATSSSPIAGVDFVSVPVQDIDRAVEFYGGVLGLPERKRWGSMPGVEFQAGNLTLALMVPEAFGQTFSPNAPPIAFQVEDVEAVRAALPGTGHRVPRRDHRQRRVPQAIFSDPDGNPLDLHHRLRPRRLTRGGRTTRRRPPLTERPACADG
jgi:catechol 2,3-dioxygenase-like lactoylglutathione lyase family enzyme